MASLEKLNNPVGSDIHHDQIEPFVIRGHHATNYWRLLHKGYTPGFISGKLVEAAKTYSTPEVEDYFADVFGTTEDEITASVARHKAVFQRFLDLSAEAPVHFVVDQKDNICNSCAVGAHCLLPLEGTGDGADERGIKAAVIVAKAIELDDTITPLDVNLPPEKGAQMPAWVAHDVLSTYEYGITFDALGESLDSLKLYLDVAGMPDYHELIAETIR